MERVMSDLWQQMRNAWILAGVQINPGATPDSIGRIEEKRCIRLPDELRDYLLVSNGMQEGEIDDELISFHSLDLIDSEWEWNEGQLASDIAEEPMAHCGDRNNATNCSHGFVDIVFADWLHNSHVYSLRLSRDGQPLGVWCLDGTNSKCLAETFSEFVAGYLSHASDTANTWA